MLMHTILIQNLAFKKNKQKKTLQKKTKKKQQKNNLEDATVLCIGFTHF